MLFGWQKLIKLISISGVRGVPGVVCWTAKLEVQGSNLDRQKFGLRSLFLVHPYSASGTTSKRIPEPVPSLELT